MNSNTALSTVSFCGTSITTVIHENQPFVGMKSICQGIGLAWNAQYEKIKRHSVLTSVVRVIRISADDGKNYQAVCLPLSMLTGWLFGVDANRVKENAREKLITYQTECFQVLHDYWFKSQPTVPTIQPQSATATIQPVSIGTLPVMTYNGQRVIISKNLISAFDVDEDVFYRTCVGGEKQLKEGVHYFKLHGRDVIKNNVMVYGGDALNGVGRKFWTRTGAITIANLLNTAKAAARIVEIDSEYFSKSSAPIATLPAPVLPLETIESAETITMQQKDYLADQISMTSGNFHDKCAVKTAIYAVMRKRFGITDIIDIPASRHDEARNLLLDIQELAHKFHLDVLDFEELFINRHLRVNPDLSVIKQLLA